MTPPPDQSWEFVLQRLNEINESLHALRSEVNGQIGRLATAVAGLTQWKESHEQWAGGHVKQMDVNTVAIAALKEITDTNTGALKMLKLLGGVILILIALGEFILHARGT